MFPARTSGLAVLVVDDDARVRRLTVDALREAGFDVSEKPDGKSAFEHLQAHRTDLVVLDIGLPGIDGLDLLHQVRADQDIPIILLTARRGEIDRVLGLELGADDYVTKPFSPRELVARVKTVLRRSAQAQGRRSRLEFGDLVIDVGTREVLVRDSLIELTVKEFDLLAYLAGAPRQVFSRRQLLQAVWHSTPDWQAESTITEHVHRLRHKLESDPARPRWLRTVRGIGYRFEP